MRGDGNLDINIENIASQYQQEAIIDAIETAAITSSVPTATSATKYAQTFGNGSALSFGFDHNLNTRDCVVHVYRNSGNFETLEKPDAGGYSVYRPTANRVELYFTVAPDVDDLRVVIWK